MGPQNSFSRLSRKILLFLKKLLNKKNIQHLICYNKKVIFIFGIKLPLAGHIETQRPRRKQSKKPRTTLISMIRNIVLVTHCLSKIPYRTVDQGSTKAM